MAFSLNEFKYGSQDYKIAELLVQGKSREEVIKTLFPLVAERSPFIFRENAGGYRRAKPRMEQYRLFLYQVARTIGKMEKEGWSDPEPYIEKRKWTSKERAWVKWRTKYIMDLVEEGLIKDPDTGVIKPKNPSDVPEPGSVTPVDPSGNPLNGKNKGTSIYSQDDLTDWYSALDEENLLERVYDDDNVPKWVEKNENDDEVAEWEELDDGVLKRTPVGDKKGKYDDDYKGLIASLVEKPVKAEPPPPPPTRVDLIDTFYREMMIARDFVMSRELSGEYLDFVSTRAIKDGAKAIAHGISVNEVMEAVTKTWSVDSRSELKRHTKAWKPKPATVNVDDYPSSLNGAHRYLGYVEILAEARIPIFLVGPSGCGKSFLARDLADAFDVDYGELPLTAGATPSWLVGAETISGYKSRPFVEIYEKGGVFCFEEMDASDPNMLLLVNNAIANESFTNPVTGKEIEKHPDFIPIATANTWGLGANRQFTGRERLDAATLDRWRVGRVEMDYDEAVEKMIIKKWKHEADKLENPTPVKAIKKAKKKVTK